MKNLKINLSKTSWIILSVGVFIVVLAGLGVTYSQQLKANSQAKDELALTELRMEKFDIDELEQQESVLSALLEDSTALHDTGIIRFQESIASIDVTNKSYAIAAVSGVEIIDIGTTDVQSGFFMDLPCKKIVMKVTVRGELTDMITFVLNMNDSFETGYIEAIQTVVDEEAKKKQECETKIKEQCNILLYKVTKVSILPLLLGLLNLQIVYGW